MLYFSFVLIYILKKGNIKLEKLTYLLYNIYYNWHKWSVTKKKC